MTAEPHAHEHIHDDAHAHVHEDEIAPVRASYAPVQFAAVGLGAFFLAIGAIGLARMGFDLGNLRDRSTTVFGMGMTPMLAWIQLGVGVLALICAGGKELARGAMMVIGSIMAAAGIVVIMQPDIIQSWLGMNTVNGVAYLVAGGVGLAMTIGTPITAFHRRRDHVASM